MPIMSRLRRVFFVFIIHQIVSLWCPCFSYGQNKTDSLAAGSHQVYAIQIAASKVFIDPEFFKKKFNLTENVSFFQKGGWYKYVVGTCTSEQEAMQKLAGMPSGAFVTSFSQRKVQDTANVEKETKVSKVDNVPSSQPELKRLYNQKIHEADSVFNIARNLLLARILYVEASLLGQGKSYPKDQILEIDKQLTQKRSQHTLQKFPRKVYVIAGLTVSVLLIVSILLIIRSKKRKVPSRKRLNFKDTHESIAEVYIDEAISGEIDLTSNDNEKTREVLIQEIMLLNSNLAKEVELKTGKGCLDYGLIKPELERCLNSSNEIMRMEAEMALILLNTEDPFSFLNKLEKEFTPLEQLQVYHLMKRHQIKHTDFSRWLSSPNESIVLFSKRMIRAFHQGGELDTGKDDTIDEKGSSGKRGFEEVLSTSNEDIQTVAGIFLESKIRSMQH